MFRRKKTIPWANVQLVLLVVLPITLCSPVVVAAADTKTESSAAKPARQGFQLAFGSGVMFPMLDASGQAGDTLASRYSYQIPVSIDLGGRPWPNLYIGSYLTLAFGAEGSESRIEALCDEDLFEDHISCASVSFALGLEARYYFAPDGLWNPWLSYGAGVEGSNQSFSDDRSGYSESVLASGYTFARLGIGADYRRTALGFGPLLQFALGRFDRSTTRIGGEVVHQGAIEDPAWHLWLGAGFRIVIRP